MPTVVVAISCFGWGGGGLSLLVGSMSGGFSVGGVESLWQNDRHYFAPNFVNDSFGLKSPTTHIFKSSNASR